ncbi:hypothetical protein EHQ13_08890 [Leptospira gomenensis]|uniref:Uncharacterized protein n=1 Tax=Leptospira gomenensis TaxID=2484974 RepID=A0A5F1Y925_9LEPT|nr:hypothetical protein [Leptospira gomenensis]TGK31788.1 hypothetical protein EHQ17_13500 [Leptospira gomenensis]TGK41584.1 hypothetical protein EHQ07_15975 [Leptospira gomenensis]TGK61456.1 hypothetical protein EHQ13_08890 [Leptospira gomenensis]
MMKNSVIDRVDSHDFSVKKQYLKLTPGEHELEVSGDFTPWKYFLNGLVKNSARVRFDMLSGESYIICYGVEKEAERNKYRFKSKSPFFVRVPSEDVNKAFSILPSGELDFKEFDDEEFCAEQYRKIKNSSDSVPPEWNAFGLQPPPIRRARLLLHAYMYVSEIDFIPTSYFNELNDFFVESGTRRIKFGHLTNSGYVFWPVRRDVFFKAGETYLICPEKLKNKWRPLAFPLQESQVQELMDLYSQKTKANENPEINRATIDTEFCALLIEKSMEKAR